ncbi:sce7726 family protein [Mucilaginibacter sp. UR6-1]|uniref:sce7726 family protein n=1 Tax=Mucilaginibacter sp. UR6-1 TaxID=1435643 RepID=UPI001E2DF06B|nr:sce7726 family protein [Mucilaginibacter sp. UR6-1]MCC8410001.1 sce7726 family protein [Mucilaginibacter sp. UR6-1]
MQNIKNRQNKKAYNYALAQLFSPSLLKKLQNFSDEKNIEFLIKDSGIYPNDDDWNLIKGLQLTYDYLKLNYRCEYIYMNEIANQLLLKYHNDNSATLLKEVSSNLSIADIIIINGSTVAYEIKTELDSLDRLPSQIDSYKTIYDKINIVTHQAAVKLLKKKLDNSIGIIVLDDNGTLIEIRKAVSNQELFDPIKAVFTLRQSELIKAYEKYVSKIPAMGTALIYGFCHNWFINLNPDDARRVFTEALKSRKPLPYQFELITECHPALKMLFLGREIPKKTCTLLYDKICIFD